MGAPWLYDATRHPESAAFVVRHRSCAEAFAHGIAWVTSLTLAIFSGIVIFLNLNASPFPIAQCAIASALFVLVAAMGDWALANSKAYLSYAYMALMYGLWIALIWTSVMCRATIPAGLEYIEENWYLLQAEVVIPFTTQLDQKANYAVRGSARGALTAHVASAAAAHTPQRRRRPAARTASAALARAHPQRTHYPHPPTRPPAATSPLPCSSS